MKSHVGIEVVDEEISDDSKMEEQRHQCLGGSKFLIKKSAMNLNGGATCTMARLGSFVFPLSRLGSCLRWDTNYFCNSKMRILLSISICFWLK